jgi:hypothetical protein
MKALEDLLEAQREWLDRQDEQSAEAHRRCLADLEQFLRQPQRHFAVAGQVVGLTGPQAQQGGGIPQGTAAASVPPAAKYRKAANSGSIQSSHNT